MSSQCFSHCSKDSRLTILHLLNAISDLTSWVRKGTHWVRLLSHIPPSVSPSFLSWRLSNGWQGRLSLTGRWWSKLHWQHRRYIWAASAATPARPELLWESRRPSQCRLSYFSPDQRRHDTFGTDFVSCFSQTRLQPSQLGCREFFLREFLDAFPVALSRPHINVFWKHCHQMEARYLEFCLLAAPFGTSSDKPISETATANQFLHGVLTLQWHCH